MPKRLTTPTPLDILKTTKSAYFYVARGRITDLDIVSAFADILDDAGRDQNAALQQVVRKRAADGEDASPQISFLVFDFEEDVPFLDGGPYKERKYAFVLIAEIDHLTIAFKRHVGALESYLKQLEPVERGVVLRLFASDSTAYQRLRLRSMSASRQVIRARTLEADDLAEAMSPIGANRSIPRGVRLRTGAEIFSLLPNIGFTAHRPTTPTTWKEKAGRSSAHHRFVPRAGGPLSVSGRGPLLGSAIASVNYDFADLLERAEPPA